MTVHSLGTVNFLPIFESFSPVDSFQARPVAKQQQVLWFWLSKMARLEPRPLHAWNLKAAGGMRERQGVGYDMQVRVELPTDRETWVYLLLFL